jgi:hypothetical protein
METFNNTIKSETMGILSIFLQFTLSDFPHTYHVLRGNLSSSGDDR